MGAVIKHAGRDRGGFLFWYLLLYTTTPGGQNSINSPKIVCQVIMSIQILLMLLLYTRQNKNKAGWKGKCTHKEEQNKIQDRQGLLLLLLLRSKNKHRQEQDYTQDKDKNKANYKKQK